VASNYRKIAEIMMTWPLEAWGWSVGERWSYEPWPDVDDMGIKFDQGANVVTEGIREWFKERGWCLEVPGDVLYVAPYVRLTTAESCFHTTLAENAQSIQSRGLLTGKAVNRSTTGRVTCSDRIYVSLEEQQARKWAGDHLLGKNHPGKKWALFRLKKEGFLRGLYRDPASQTGYILEQDSVRPEHLELACDFHC
jgi:hypothetical protein